LKELLDPQGKAVLQGFGNLHLDSIKDARIGKHIELIVESDSMEKASEIVEEACSKLLANPVIEYYEYKIEEAE